ncbi:MAG: pyruvate kinase [Rubinisphaera brasiliensis]|uniref:Pyruvate kinase n=1 Tax=Rubinisphaera brasiliensis (strain ATCC 49424 / DSM 5305 / JCM 21570 / IAM 15109 / NBRC 103401 / IFAM 1448) TaxID=756272 RepID=F0SS77_RUBBR|nr:MULTISPECIES: pyruvate kinase [Rubinisphaera]ADY58088.1 pyruvate kinase [Rubinisphaera brasiliensis DSM 5305]MBB01706.1 pyruvate kinase [Planctomyces sp.]
MEVKVTEKFQARTKIIATVGPANASRERLLELVKAGVDVFRLNFAHGQYDWLEEVVATIRDISDELNQPVGLLGDLAGPKIRLGELPDEGVECAFGQEFVFVREDMPFDGVHLTSTYEHLVDDLQPGHTVLLADGTVGMEVIERESDDKIRCRVDRPGTVRSRQGINLPGTKLRTPSLTEKDREDLVWGLKHRLHFFGLSFVRHADDIIELRELMKEHAPEYSPQIVAKIEKVEAVQELESITKVCDCVMVARGDLGVETDIALLPILQKQIIRHCNERRIPVITATQMLDSMQEHPFPTRAEANDVANAVLDGTDAVMLSGETAVGKYPKRTVDMMEKIIRSTEDEVAHRGDVDWKTESKNRALVVTEAVTLGACTSAERLHADLMVVCTQSGRTALAISRQRSRIPLLALTDSKHTAGKLCLYWGVIPVRTHVVKDDPHTILNFAVKWGKERGILKSGSRIVLISDTEWGAEGHDLMVVHVVP